MSTEPSSLRATERRLEDVHRVRDLLVAEPTNSAGALGRPRPSSMPGVVAPPASRRPARARRCGSSSAASCGWRSPRARGRATSPAESAQQRRGVEGLDRPDRRCGPRAARPRSPRCPCRARCTSPTPVTHDARSSRGTIRSLRARGHELAVDLDLGRSGSPRRRRGDFSVTVISIWSPGLTQCRKPTAPPPAQPPRAAVVLEQRAGELAELPRISTPGSTWKRGKWRVEDRRACSARCGSRVAARRARARACGRSVSPVAAEHHATFLHDEAAVGAAERERVDQHGVAPRPRAPRWARSRGRSSGRASSG